jgi:hypothetical protein
MPSVTFVALKLSLANTENWLHTVTKHRLNFEPNFSIVFTKNISSLGMPNYNKKQLMKKKKKYFFFGKRIKFLKNQSPCQQETNLEEHFRFMMVHHLQLDSLIMGHLWQVR